MIVAIHYRTQGFILKKKDLREADQVFTVYTKNFGELENLGKAIRKIKSKLRSGTELFYLSEIEFIQGKTYKTLTDAITIEKFKNIRTCFVPLSAGNLDSSGNSSYSLELKQNLDRLKIAYQIAGVADNLIRGEEKDEKIWDLLNEVFNKLNNCSLFIVRCSLIYYYFLWNLLSILGYQIDLYNCALCQKKLLPEKLYFNPEEGGMIDLNCFEKIKKGEAIPPEVIKILRIFLNKDWYTLLKLKINDSYKKSLESISENYLSYATIN